MWLYLSLYLRALRAILTVNKICVLYFTNENTYMRIMPKNPTTQSSTKHPQPILYLKRGFTITDTTKSIIFVSCLCACRCRVEGGQTHEFRSSEIITSRRKRKVKGSKIYLFVFVYTVNTILKGSIGLDHERQQRTAWNRYVSAWRAWSRPVRPSLTVRNSIYRPSGRSWPKKKNVVCIRTLFGWLLHGL